MTSTKNVQLDEAVASHKQTNPKAHYTWCTISLVVGLIPLVLGLIGYAGLLGWFGSAESWMALASPILAFASLFFILPGLVGLIRGPGAPSTHEIPRPNNRYKGEDGEWVKFETFTDTLKR